MKCLPAIIVLSIALSLLSAVKVSNSDSLVAELKGNAALIFHHSGNTASENAVLRAGWNHSFTEHIETVLLLRAARNAPSLLPEQGYINLHLNTISVGAGFLSKRSGENIIFKPYSLIQPLFDRPVLWESHGFGGQLSLTRKRFAADLILSINNRENGAVAASTTFGDERMYITLLSGFQSYTIDNQDNMFTIGSDMAFFGEKFRIHLCARYSRYTGFDHSANSTMVPGETFTGYCEPEINLVKNLALKSLLYYRMYSKRYLARQLYNGYELYWKLNRYWGGGLDYEYQINNSVKTDAPGSFIRITPVVDKILLDIGGKRTKTANATVTWEVYSSLLITL
jgi:hypothetical protein